MQIENWQFDTFIRHGRTMNPNNWTIERANGVCAIVSEDNLLIDEPTDTGQSDLDLIIWGIGWLHAHYTE